MSLELSQSQREEIVGHAEREYPHECCGLLLGRLEAGGRKVVVEVFPVSNAREEGARHNRSLITPEEYLRGERHARPRRLDVVGNYHSHPDHPAAPSQFDLEHAWPTWSYVIASVSGGKAGDVRSWELAADRSRFDEEEVLTGGSRERPPERPAGGREGEWAVGEIEAWLVPPGAAPPDPYAVEDGATGGAEESGEGSRKEF